MNTKQILAIAAIAAVALAAVAGVAYAYQANLTNSGNTVESDYLTLDADAFADTFDRLNSATNSLDYNTTTTKVGENKVVTYVPAKANGSDGDHKIGTKTNGVAVNSTAYPLTVDSRKMDAHDLFVLSVQTTDSTGAGKSLSGYYWLEFQVDSGPVSAVALDSADKIEFLAMDSPNRDTTGTPAAITVNLTLYAVEFDGDLSSKVPGLDEVSFKFTAESKALTGYTNKGAITTKVGSTATEADGVFVTAQNGYGKMYYTTSTTSTTGVYEITHIDVTSGYASAFKSGYTATPVAITLAATTPTNVDVILTSNS